jgi:hypothetical protein
VVAEEVTRRDSTQFPVASLELPGLGSGIWKLPQALPPDVGSYIKLESEIFELRRASDETIAALIGQSSMDAGPMASGWQAEDSA